MSKKTHAMLLSYGRSMLAAVIALYLTGETDWNKYLYVLVAAVAPVALRYLDKNDIAFGRISGDSTPDEFAKEVVKGAVKVSKAVKKPVVKAPAKKVTVDRSNPKPTQAQLAEAKKAKAKKVTPK